MQAQRRPGLAGGPGLRPARQQRRCCRRRRPPQGRTRCCSCPVEGLSHDQGLLCKRCCSQSIQGSSAGPLHPRRRQQQTHRVQERALQLLSWWHISVVLSLLRGAVCACAQAEAAKPHHRFTLHWPRRSSARGGAPKAPPHPLQQEGADEAAAPPAPHGRARRRAERQHSNALQQQVIGSSRLAMLKPKQTKYRKHFSKGGCCWKQHAKSLK